MPDILQQIVASKKQEVKKSKESISFKELEKAIESNRFPNHSLAKALNEHSGIIAEFKRASPSKGAINSVNNPDEIVKGYDVNGALGISVLTDRMYFKAKHNDFTIARNSTNKPLLRKEFIIDTYQIYESKAMGASVILLIAAILSEAQIAEFTLLAHSLGLEVLIELHEKEEVYKLSGDEDIIGVNNRNLKTFTVDINQSILLKKELGKISAPLISESGLSDIGQVEILLNEGFNGFLMGEYFMKQSNPIGTFAEFKTALDNLMK